MQVCLRLFRVCRLSAANSGHGRDGQSHVPVCHQAAWLTRQPFLQQACRCWRHVRRPCLPLVYSRYCLNSQLDNEGQKMDDGLLLNLNFEGNGLAHTKAADWRSRKREAHEKQQKKRQQHRDNRAAHARGTAAATTVAAATPMAESANGTSAVQPQRITKQRFNQSQPLLVAGQSTASADRPSQPIRSQHQRPTADSLHGYGAVVQKQQTVRTKSAALAGKSGALAHAPPASSDPPWKRAKPTNVAALAEVATAAADSLTAGAEADIAALVALNMEVEQRIQQDAVAEPGRIRPADQDKALPRVIEFGDTPDEPDFLNPTPQQAKKRKTHHATSNPSTHHTQEHTGSTRNQKHHQTPIAPTDKQQQLTQHKAGDLTHAEPNVPAEQRQQLFGDRSTAAATDSIDSHSWQGLGLAEDLADHLIALNFQEPTAVQQQTIPLLLRGRDACVRSPTGSGKTLCYLAPLIHTLQSISPPITRRDGTHALVLVPTRELAVQVTDVLTAVVRRFCWLVPGMLIGGEHRGHEKARLRKGVTVLVATPGRLLDHLQNTTSFKTQKLSWLVLDEADRLLDLGFEQKLKQIVEALDARVAAAADNSYSTEAQHQRQTVLLSATLHPGLTTLAGLSMKDPIGVGFNLNVVDGQMQLAENDSSKQHGGDKPDALEMVPAGAAAGAAAGQLEVPQQLQQRFVEVPAKMRLVVLTGVLCSRLRRSKSAKLVVFFSNCDSVDFHHQLLLHQQQGGDAVGDADESDLLLGASPVLKLHGDMRQPERTSSLVTFAKATSCVLLCTDVAARGLDFPAVSTIIQYDPAGDPAEYVHRVGRTARMGQQGDALIFLLPSELPYVQMLKQRGVQVMQELAGNLLKCLPGLAGPAGPSMAVLQFARKIQRGGGSGKLGQPKESKDRGSAANTQMTAAAAKQVSGGFENEGLMGSKPVEVAAALLLQRQLIQTVASDDDLSRLALNAFRSFVRAYTTHPFSVKHVFHVKSLHLGHLAASFGLREAPKKIGAGGATVERKKRKLEGQKAAVKKQKQAWHKTAKAAAAMGL